MKNANAFLFFWAAVFTLYILTLSPTVGTGDSGDLTAAAFSIGGAHPPGYILHAVLGKAFALLPFGNVAFRVNALSAFFSALSGAVVLLTAYELTSSAAVSASAALFFSLSGLVWQSSVAAEVYALNLFLVSLLFLFGIRAVVSEHADVRLLYLSALVMGIGMGNHHTVALTAPGLLFAFALKRRAYITPRNVSLAVLFFALGFSVNIALMLRTDALYDYTYAKGLKGFWRAFIRADYVGGDTIDALEGTAKSTESWLYGIVNFSRLALREYKYFVPVAAAGAFALLIKNRRVFFFLAICALVWVSVLYGGTDYSPIDKFTVEQFMLPMFIPAALFIGMGLHFIYGRGIAPFVANNMAQRALSLFIILLPVVSLLPRNISDADLSENYYGYQPSKDALTMLPPNSFLLNYTDDHIFGSWYLQLVERHREDVFIAGAKLKSNFWQFPSGLSGKFKDIHPEIYPKDYKKDYKKRDGYARDAFGGRLKFFVTHNEGLSENLDALFGVVPYGHIGLCVPKGTKWDAKFMRQYVRKPIEKMNYERLTGLPLGKRGLMALTYSMRYSTVFWDYAIGFAAEGRAEEADKYYNIAIELYPEEKLIESYEELFKRSRR